MGTFSQIKYGAIISYVAISVNVIAGLLYTPWMIQSIGRAEFGLYTLAMSVISLFVFDFGLSVAVTRFVAKYIAEEKTEETNGFLGLVFKLYLYLDLVILAVLLGIFFFIPQIYKELTPEEIDKFQVVYIIASIFSIMSFPFIPVNGILTAHEKFIQLKLCDLGHKLVIVVAMSVCLLLGYGLYALVAVNAVAGIFTIGLKCYFIRRSTNTHINFKYKNRLELREILGFSGWTTVISISQRFIFNITPSILGIMSGSVGIALFGIAMTIEGYIFIFANAINGLFLPRVTQTMNRGQKDILPLMIRVGRIQIFIIGLIIIGFISLGQDFITLWVGPDFRATYVCAVLLILPSFVQLPQEIAATAVVVQNKVRAQAYVYLIMAAINILLALLFTKYWGALGVAVSICIAYIFRTIGMNYLYYKMLHIDLLSFFRESFFKMGPALFSGLFSGLLIQYFVPLSGWMGFLVKGILLVSVYLVIMWRKALNDSERNLFLQPILLIYKKYLQSNTRCSD